MVAGAERMGQGNKQKSLQSEQGVFRPLCLPAACAAVAAVTGTDGGAGLSSGDTR